MDVQKVIVLLQNAVYSIEHGSVIDGIEKTKSALKEIEEANNKKENIRQAEFGPMMNRMSKQLGEFGYQWVSGFRAAGKEQDDFAGVLEEIASKLTRMAAVLREGL